MESHSYSSCPESGDSSPRSREIECENTVASWDDQPLPPPSYSSARVKLMCSYAGRIQPRHHDNQLSYVGGETKILAVDRSIRFPAFLSRLSSLIPPGSATEICVKYQLPGEDLDALISVTNDEDLEHMMIEYDRLVRSASKPAPRLRLFLFTLTSPNSTGSDQKPERQQWFLDSLNSLPQQQPPPPMLETIPPPLPPASAAVASPDFLFGLDAGFVPPPAVKIKDPAPEPTVVEPIDVTVRSDPGSKEEKQVGEAVVSPAEMQRQIQELQMLRIAENQKIHQQQQQQQQQQLPVAAAAAAFQRNDSDEALATRGLPAGEYYLPRAQENPHPQIPSPAAAAAQYPPPAAYWPDQMGMAAGGRYASMAGGEQPVYLIPAGRGVYPGGGGGGMHPPPHAYYAVPRMVTAAEAYRETAAMYAVAAQAGGNAAQDYSVAYDSAGRAVYYTSAVPTYQTVGPASTGVEGAKVAAKPPQVS